MDGAMEDLLNVMVKNEVILPREFVMIGRGIALIEDTCKKNWTLNLMPQQSLNNYQETS